MGSRGGDFNRKTYDFSGFRCRKFRLPGLAGDAVKRPRLKTASEVMASLIPPKRECKPTNGPSQEAREKAFGADLGMALDRMVPWTAGYAHGEGNSAAHMKASLMGSSARILVSGGRLCLGTWQGVFFCEFDGPRQREVWVQ